MFRSACSTLRRLPGTFQPTPSTSGPSLVSRLPNVQFAATPSPALQQVRLRSQLAPKRTKYRKAHKGRVGLPTGGSTKGTTLQLGTYGLRVLGNTRLTAKQLTSAEVAVKRKIKVVKGAECWMRVFPDVAVCVKGNETRMGKGKGGFDHWACRVPVGKVVFEVGGGGIREEIAKEAAKLPIPTEFITTASAPRLGSISDASLLPPRISPAATEGQVAQVPEGPAETGLDGTVLLEQQLGGMKLDEAKA